MGTEFGAYFTIDGGVHWTQLKSGIPGVPVHDLQIQPRANDLVAGTHGRGIYILDDLTPLENLAQAKQASVAYLFPVQDALLFQPNASRSSGMGTHFSSFGSDGFSSSSGHADHDEDERIGSLSFPLGKQQRPAPPWSRAISARSAGCQG